MDDYKTILYSSFKKSEFPTKLVDESCLKFKEYLFDNNSAYYVNKKKNLSNGYILEDSRKKTWRNKNFESSESNNEQSNNTNQDINKLIINEPEKVNKNVITNFEHLNIENIFFLNDKIKYSYDLPLWYVINPFYQQLGPISSKQIHDMYINRMIDGNWDVRLLDIFQIKDVKNFSFVKLKFINDEKWCENVIDSSLIELTELCRLSWNVVKNNINDQDSNKVDKTVDLTIIDNPIENKKPTEVKLEENIIITKNVIKEEKVPEESWEVVGKNKKKKKENEQVVYYLENKKKEKEIVKEEVKTKFSKKIEIISGEEMVNCLKPKKVNK